MRGGVEDAEAAEAAEAVEAAVAAAAAAVCRRELAAGARLAFSDPLSCPLALPLETGLFFCD